MDEKVHDYLLIFELFQIYIFGFIGSLGDPFHDGVCIAELMMLYNLLHLRQLSIMVRHVGSQNQIDGSLSEMSVFLSAQLVHELAFFIIENSKHLRCVETFLGRYIIAVNGSA